MLRLDQSDSELDDTENRSSEVESEEGNSNGRKQEEISEYEKQRLSRIAENKAKMEAMGLAKMASSLIGSPQNSSKRKGKRRVVEDDEDYMPDDDDGDIEDGDGDYDIGFKEDHEEFLGNKASTFAKGKVDTLYVVLP